MTVHREPGRPAPLGRQEAAVEIRLLGAPEITGAGRSLPRPAPVVLQLLTYLVLHHRHQRSLVCTDFWPDVAEQQARRRLNTAVWRLRSYLDPVLGGRAQAVIRAEADDLVFNPAGTCWCDISSFEAAVQRMRSSGFEDPGAAADLEDAVALYRGDLLEGCYDDWLLRDREHLLQCYLSALEHLAEWHHRAGNLDRAVELADQVVDRDPFRESVHRGLMVLHMERGDRPAALRQFSRCAQVLLDHLGTAPMPQTLALEARIRGSGTAPGDGDPDLTVALEELRAARDHAEALGTRLSNVIRALESPPRRESRVTRVRRR